MAGNTNYVGCTYQIGMEFFEEWGVDVAAYTGEAAAGIGSNIKYPYRYDTEKMYGFCVPSFNADADTVSALSDSAIKTFKRLFDETITNDKTTSYIADIVSSW